jgi:hypothetical protein
MEAWNERLRGAFGKYERGQDIAPPQVRVLQTHNVVTRSRGKKNARECGRFGSSGGGTRTHNPSINSRMLCH